MGVLREDIDNILKQDINWDKLRKSNVLITGAGGMLGSYMMKTLIVLNEEKSFDMNIYVLVRGENRIPPEFRKKGQRQGLSVHIFPRDLRTAI